MIVYDDCICCKDKPKHKIAREVIHEERKIDVKSSIDCKKCSYDINHGYILCKKHTTSKRTPKRLQRKCRPDKLKKYLVAIEKSQKDQKEFLKEWNESGFPLGFAAVKTGSEYIWPNDYYKNPEDLQKKYITRIITKDDIDRLRAEADEMRRIRLGLSKESNDRKAI